MAFPFWIYSETKKGGSDSGTADNGEGYPDAVRMLNADSTEVYETDRASYGKSSRRYRMGVQGMGGEQDDLSCDYEQSKAAGDRQEDRESNCTKEKMKEG